MPAGGTPKHFDLGELQQLLDSGFTLLTPNQRLARRIKAEWDRSQIEQGRTCWEPVAVRALDHWLADRWREAVNRGLLPPRKVLSSLQQAELWRSVIEKDGLDRGEYSLLRTDAAIELAQQGRDNLLRSRVNLLDTGVQSEFRLDTDCATFLRWLRSFDAALQQHNSLTPLDCVAQLIEAPGMEGAGPVALVDFDDIPDLYRRAADAICTEVRVVASAQGEAPVTARSYTDRRAELAAVAAWAAGQYRDNPGCSLGILLADMQADRAELEYLLRREFDCLGENYTALPVNFSTGITLDRAPVIRDALHMLSVAGQNMPLRDILALLQSRFSPYVDDGSARAVKLLQQLFDDGAEQVSMGRLRTLAAKVSVDEERGLPMADCLVAIDKLRLQRERQPPSAWIGAFCQQLEIFAWPGNGPLDSLEYQQVEGWYAVLETFAGLDAIVGDLDFGSALGLLRRSCQNRISQPETADSGIQVLGPLEGAGLQFDSIWLCGLQGSRWPAPVRPNPFIPMAVQRRFAMPHSSAEREWQYASTLVAQYRAGCKQMTASYSRQVDGVPELPSPLLQEFPVADLDGTVPLAAAWTAAREGASLLAAVDETGPEVDARERTGIRGGSGILQAQANCPFRAFAGKRLSLEPLGEYRSGLTAAERGSLLHDALYALWGELADSDTLAAMDAAAVALALDRAVDAAVDAVHTSVKQLVGMHCLDLEKQRLRALLQEWLEVERSRDSFRVAVREQPVEFQLAGLPLSLRVDRVDELADGSRLVIDYKSGRSSLSSWMGERPSQPQLPLYGLTGEVSGLAFAQLRSRDCRMIGLGQVSGVPGIKEDIAKAVKRYSDQEDWQGLLGQWRSNLQRLAEAFLAGEAQVDPLPGACNYCGLEALCRIQLSPEVMG